MFRVITAAVLSVCALGCNLLVTLPQPGEGSTIPEPVPDAPSLPAFPFDAGPVGVTPPATLTCDEHFADCDGDPDNGCETDTLTDAWNCGGCGNSCVAEGACGDGVCGAFELDWTSGTVETMATDGDHIYWTTGSQKVKRIARDGVGGTTIAFDGELINPDVLAVDASNIYAANDFGLLVINKEQGAVDEDVAMGPILQIALGPSGLSLLTAYGLFALAPDFSFDDYITFEGNGVAITTPRRMDRDASHVVIGCADKITALVPEGGTATVLDENLYQLQDVLIRDGWVYYTLPNIDGLRRTQSSGLGFPEQLSTTPSVDLQADETHVYFSHGRSDEGYVLSRVLRSDGSIEGVLREDDALSAYLVTDDAIYWAVGGVLHGVAKAAAVQP